jgi:hypothetical protein
MLLPLSLSDIGNLQKLDGTTRANTLQMTKREGNGALAVGAYLQPLYNPLPAFLPRLQARHVPIDI